MSNIKAGGNFIGCPSLIGNTAGTSSSGPPPTYTPALQFNDTGGSGGGDRNSMYLPIV